MYNVLLRHLHVVRLICQRDVHVQTISFSKNSCDHESAMLTLLPM